LKKKKIKKKKLTNERELLDRLLVLLEQWTRADVMSRVSPLPSDICYALVKLKKENEIKELVFGTSDLIVLAHKWGMMGKKVKKKKHVLNRKS